MNLGQVIKYAAYFEISDYVLEKTYDFEAFKRTIVARMEKIGWILPEHI